MNFRQAKPEDAPSWASMRAKLWPGEDHTKEIASFFTGTQREPVVVFLAEQDDKTPCGFAEISVRHDYVEGAATSPVAYLEGWYVEPLFRGRNIGKGLLKAAELWASESGFTEFASDVSIENKESLKAHLASGFNVVGTITHLVKPTERNRGRIESCGPANPALIKQQMNTDSSGPVQYVELRFNRKRLVLKWYSDDIDHIAQKSGRVIDYSNAGNTPQVKFNADASLKSILSNRPDFSLILDLINILEDIGYSKNRVSKKLYDKVFFGCNLPSVRKGGKLYQPVLSVIERSKLEKYISGGCEHLFNNAIRYKDKN